MRIRRSADTSHQKRWREERRRRGEKRHTRKEVERRAGLQGWSDASWEAFSPSITGHVQFVNGGPVAWSSKKQPSTSLSSAEAETYAAASGAAEVVWVRGLLADMGMPMAWCDGNDTMSPAIPSKLRFLHAAHFPHLSRIQPATRQRMPSWSARMPPESC